MLQNQTVRPRLIDHTLQEGVCLGRDVTSIMINLLTRDVSVTTVTQQITDCFDITIGKGIDSFYDKHFLLLSS